MSDDIRHKLADRIRSLVPDVPVFVEPAQIKDVSCPQCHRPFVLRWQTSWRDSEAKVTLDVRGCPSGGVYDVLIRCPHCNYEEPL